MMRRFLRRLAALFRSRHADADLAREIDAHLRLLEDTFIAQGLSAHEARYAARRAFGGVEQTKERQRDARSFTWLAGWPMDLKLGARMLVKSPGLTVVAVLALSVAIGAGAAYLEFVNDLARPTLPAKDGGRIVGILNWDASTGRPDHRSLHDFAVWRGALASIDHLGAYQSFERNLMTDDGRIEPVRGVQISASAFRLIPTPPLLGRPLIEGDERSAASPVVVLGQPLWQARFNGEPGVVGRTVRLGGSPHIVVGVMPAGFGFPINHSLWVPLRVTEADYKRGDGPRVGIFGRLAPGATLEGAQAEVTAVAQRAAAGAPDSNQRFRPKVEPYVDSLWSSIQDGHLQLTILYSVNVFFLGLLAVCGANVATLVFARTATRESEITVRTALGASRGRIVAQLFAEALVLAFIAAAVGLMIAGFALRWGSATWVAAQGSTPPFWWNDRLSAGAALYAGVLAILAAAIVGVVPALKVTGPQMQARLKHAAGAASGMKFGGVWTGIIVAQVALTVIFLFSIVSLGWNLYAGRYETAVLAFPVEEYLSARIEMDREAAPADAPEAAQATFRVRFDAAYAELERRLERDPAVAGTTYADRLPGMTQAEFFVEMEGLAPLPGAADPLWVGSASVAPDFFETFNAPITAGRGFTRADAAFERPVAIVDHTFVRTILGGRDPVGRRVRQPQNSENAKPGPWLEIVGVVRDLSTVAGKTSEQAVLYRPAAPGGPSSMRIVVHARGDAKSLASSVRAVAAAADPSLRLYELTPLEELNRADRLALSFFVRALAIVSAVALLLSMAGVYALMSFTLSRRTREIGIRAALGAAPRRIITAIFSRSFAQVGLGVLAGSVPGAVLVALGAPEVAPGSGPLVAAIAVVAVAVVIGAVTAFACAVPARRALRIPPTDALRAE